MWSALFGADKGVLSFRSVNADVKRNTGAQQCDIRTPHEY